MTNKYESFLTAHAYMGNAMDAAYKDGYDAGKRKQWVELTVTDIENITHKAISIVDAMLLTEETLKEKNK
jgi:hypothetical protein